jgi:hypothetical protein
VANLTGSGISSFFGSSENVVIIDLYKVPVPPGSIPTSSI